MISPLYKALTAAVMATLLGPATAGVLIESHNADGYSGRVLISGDRARVEGGNRRYWLLLDLSAGTILAVKDQERLAMDMKSPIPQRSEHEGLFTNAPPPRIRFEEGREGPLIAGFRTMHYRVMVDDIHCYDEYLAPEALENSGIRRFVTAMSEGSDNTPRRALIQLLDPERICEASDDLIDDHYPLAGIPMRTLDADGRLIQEITRISFDQEYDPALFDVPAGYPVLSRTEVIEQTGDRQRELDELQQKLDEIERQMQAAEPAASD